MTQLAFNFMEVQPENLAFGGSDPEVDTCPHRGVSWDDEGKIVYPEEEEEATDSNVVPIKQAI